MGDHGRCCASTLRSLISSFCEHRGACCPEIAMDEDVVVMLWSWPELPRRQSEVTWTFLTFIVHCRAATSISICASGPIPMRHDPHRTCDPTRETGDWALGWGTGVWGDRACCLLTETWRGTAVSIAPRSPTEETRQRGRGGALLRCIKYRNANGRENGFNLPQSAFMQILTV